MTVVLLGFTGIAQATVTTVAGVSPGCDLTNAIGSNGLPANCTESDVQAIIAANSSAVQNETNIANTGQAQALSNKYQAAVARASTPAACTAEINSWSAFFSPSCWPSLLSGVIGGALVSLAAWILAVAGILFNLALQYTVLQFGSWITGSVLTFISTAWSVFRDISNIVIIGMFTFIALATILGIESYGYKKLISRVLIVAVLINFSLLFTKIIIDASNFTATQFSTATSGMFGFQGPCPNGQSVDPGTGSCSAPDTSISGQLNAGQAQPGIAGVFMRYAGVSGFGDTATVVTTISRNQGAWLGLIYGIVIALLFLVAAVVLFYGTFLLISRALLMIFLMITSSIAFATYLIPSLSNGSYGWGAWWSALLKNAVFAPLLMVLLWVSLGVGSAFAKQSGSLGQLIQNPQNLPDITALFGYIVVIGLLFISFKLASSFATQIGGFNFAQGAFSASVMGALRGTAPILRNAPIIGGRGQAARAKALEKDIEAEARAQARLKPEDRNLSKLSKLISQKGAAEARAKSTFDIGNTRIGQAVGKTIGTPAFLLKKTKTNFADSSKEKAEGAAKAATAAAVPKEEAEKIARRDVEKDHEERRNELKEQHESNTKLLKEVQEGAQKTKDSEKLEEKAADAKAKLKERDEEVSKAKVDIDERHARGEISLPERNRLINEQDERIKQANALVQTIQNRIGVIDKPVKEQSDALKKTNEDIIALNKKVEDQIKQRTQEIVKAGVENAQVVGANLTQNWLQKTLNLPADGITAEHARSLTKKKIGTKGLKERISAEREVLKDAGEDGGGEAKSTEGTEEKH